MGSYWLCTLPTSQAAVVQGQQPAEGGNSERSWEHMQEERAKRWILKRNPHCFASYMEIKLSMITVEPLGIIVYLLLSAFPVLVRIKEFKRSRKCKVWCWNGKWAAVTTWPSHSISTHFPHLEHFPEKCESEGLFFLFFPRLSKVLFLSENMTVGSDMLVWDKSSPHSHHQPHLISVKHYSAEKWLTPRCLWSVEVRRDSPWGRSLAVLGRVCHAPQVGTVCIFL